MAPYLDDEEEEERYALDRQLAEENGLADEEISANLAALGAEEGPASPSAGFEPGSLDSAFGGGGDVGLLPASRDDFLENQMGIISGLEGEKREAAEEMLRATAADDESGDWSSLLGRFASAILPIALGYSYAGTSGAAEASKGVAANYQRELEQAEKRRERDQARARLQYQEKSKEVNEAKKTRNIIQRDVYNQEFQNSQREQREADILRRPRAAGITRPTYEALPEDHPLRAEYLRVFKVPAPADFSSAEAESVFRARKSSDDIMGTKTKQLSPKELKELANARFAVQDLGETIAEYGADTVAGQKVLDELRKANPNLKSVYSDFAAGKITSDYAIREMEKFVGETTTSQLTKEMTMLARQIASASEAGVLSNQDVANYLAAFVVEPTESTETYFNRISRTWRRMERKLAMQEDTMVAGGVNVPGADSSSLGGQSNDTMKETPRQELERLRAQYKRQ